MPQSRSPSDLNEQSPLIVPENTSEDGEVNEVLLSHSLDLDDSVAETKSSAYLVLLTLCIGGLQIVWSVELSNGSPFLLSLGMSKALLAVVWLAGPLTGALVQPYVGILSDNCRISWGKRKPFMIFGASATIVSLLGLAWTKEIVLGAVRLLGGDAGGKGAHISILTYATVLMWILDFSINTIQAAMRAFIVDNAPAHQQESANAWASRIVGIGSVLGYIFGYIDLPRYFSFLGDTQFKVLVVLASILLSSTLLISCLYIKERDPRLEGPSKWGNGPPGLLAFLREVFVSIKRMPPQIRKVCEIQFFHWIGWFPFLFYITTYIGQLYVDPFLTPDMTDTEVDALWAKATRIGTLALLVYAIVSLAANVLLPFVVVPTYKPSTTDDAAIVAPTSPIGARHRRSSLGDLPYFGSTASLSNYSGSGYPNSPPPTVFLRALKRLQIPGLTLRRTWFLSQLLFALCMFSTFFIRTPLAAIVMTALVGVSWSLTLWAPFALISAEIAHRDKQQRWKKRAKLHHGGVDDGVEDEDLDQAGVILGLHNVAVSSPQVLATLVSSVIFKVLQKPRNVPGDTSVSWTLRIGGLAALAAASVTSRLGEGSQDD